jgi:transcription elongation factor GreA
MRLDRAVRTRAGDSPLKHSATSKERARLRAPIGSQLGPTRGSSCERRRADCSLRRVATDRPEPLTRAQKKQLEAELAELEGPKRAAIVEAIATARGFGDLSENFEYHAAKNEQGLLERRITLLRDRLDRAVLVDQDAAPDTVGVGSRVVVEDERGEQLQIEISSVGGVSPDSPLGRALLGRRTGEEVEVEAPRGAWRARILSIGR